jgi:hypothetical protein
MRQVITRFIVGLCLIGASVHAGIPTTNTITIRWTAPGDDGTVGKAYRYDIRYSTSAITAANWDQANRAVAMPLPGTPGALQTCTVTGLVPNTTYYFRMKTADEKYNWSGLSNQFSMTTCGGVCTGTTGNVDCSPDNRVDVSDLTALLDYEYISTDPVCICLSEANIDGDPQGRIDISDIAKLIDYLYISLIPLPSCPHVSASE